MSLEELDIAAGLGGTREARAQAARFGGATAAGRGIGLDRSVSVVNQLAQDAASTAALLRTASGDETYANLQELVSAAGIGAEKQKEIFGDQDLTRVGKDQEDVKKFLGSVQATITSDVSASLRTSGWLSDENKKIYNELANSTDGSVGRVARGLKAAADKLSEDPYAAVALGAASIEGMATMSTQDYRRTRAAFAAGGAGPTFSEVDKFRAALSGRSEGGSRLTMGELEGMGANREFLLGKGMTADMLTPEGLRGAGAQRLARGALAEGLVPGGDLAGREEQKEGPSSPMAAAFEEGFTRAMGSTIMRVQVVDGKSIGGEATGKPDSEGEQKN